MRLVKRVFLPWVFIISCSSTSFSQSSKSIVAYNSFYLQQTGLLKFQKYFLAPPTVYSITPAGSACDASEIGMSNSEIGFSYQLKIDGTNVGVPVDGTGAAFDFPGTQTTPGTYTVEAIDPADPLNPVPMSGTVVINASPAAPTITPDAPTTFCQGGSVTLTSTPATSYQWFESGNLIAGATNAAYSVNASGNYTVQITDANGCTATSIATSVTVSSCFKRSASKTKNSLDDRSDSSWL